MRWRSLTGPSALLILAGVWSLPPVRANDLNDTTRSAIFLLEESMKVTRSGRHHTMLLTLRHLGDPELAPFFSQLWS